MIIFENGLIKLDYDPSTDILFVDMPTVNSIVMPEVRRALAIIVEHVRNYDVKRLLIDARKTEVEVNEESYATMIGNFSGELLATRIQRVARIVTHSEVRENVVREVYKKKQLPIDFQSFTEIAPAVEWLTR